MGTVVSTMHIKYQLIGSYMPGPMLVTAICLLQTGQIPASGCPFLHVPVQWQCDAVPKVAAPSLEWTLDLQLPQLIAFERYGELCNFYGLKRSAIGMDTGQRFQVAWLPDGAPRWCPKMVPSIQTIKKPVPFRLKRLVPKC